MTDATSSPTLPLLKGGSLPLPLKRKQSERPASNVLPLPLNRKLGMLEPVKPVVKRLMNGAALELVSDVLSVQTVAMSAKSGLPAVGLGNDYYAYAQPVFTIANEFRLASLAFYPLANESYTILTNSYLVANAYRVRYHGLYLLANDNKSTISPTVGYVTCSRVNSAKMLSFKACVSEPLQPVINFAHCLNPTQAGVSLENEHGSKVQQAIPVPCRYYPIPEPPPPPIVSVCGIRPPSSRLALPLNRVRNPPQSPFGKGGGLPASNLPLPLLCWHDTAPQITPNLRSYIVHNTITATLGGLAINPISFGFKADMSGYCWQGNVDITEYDYQRIKSKLDVEKGNEPLLYVTVNGVVFGFIYLFN